MNLIERKNIFLSVSGLLVLVSIAAISIWGLNLGIDFTGGTLLEVEFDVASPTPAEIRGVLEPLAGSVTVQPSGERGVIIRMRHIDEDTHRAALERLVGLGPLSEKRFVAIGSVLGKELLRKSVIALAAAIFAIVLYITWAFRKVSDPVPSWKYGVCAIVALIHDILLPVGVFAFLGRFYRVEIDVFFVTALLTILGFSVHDTIVVFDRIRENLKNLKIKEPFGVTVNRGVNDTIARSINTSLTTLLTLFAIMVVASGSVRFFALALSLGVIFGTYSSIFVASPLLVIWYDLTHKK